LACKEGILEKPVDIDYQRPVESGEV